MALDWSDAAKAQLAGGNIRPAIFLRVAATTGVIRLWSGIGDFAIPEDLIEDVDQAEYLGAGELVDLPRVEALINGQAGRAEFSLSGVAVTPQIAALASSEADSIRQAPVSLGVMILGEDLQPLSTMAWLWDGEADVLEVRRSGDTRALVLSVGSAMTGRRRPPQSYWSDADQKRRSSDDRFWEQAAIYNAGTTKPWPR